MTGQKIENYPIMRFLLLCFLIHFAKKFVTGDKAVEYVPHRILVHSISLSD